MKVLQFGKHFPPDIGGIESVIAVLTRSINALGVRSDVLCASTRNVTEIVKESGYTVMRIASWGKFASTAISPGLIWHFFKIHRQYDIVHVHMPDPLVIVSILLARPKARIVLHWHGDVDFTKFKWLGYLYKPLEKILIRRADKVIMATHSHYNFSINRDIFAEKFSIIPYALDPEFVAQAHDKQRGTESLMSNKNSTFKIFSVGRLIYYKGFDYLVESAKFLNEDYEIIIGGSGPLRESLEIKIQSMGLQNKVRLIGRLTDSELLEAHRGCDVFCLPSISQGEMFGMVQLEAMCFGKPVVSTLIPNSGVAEVNINAETGLVVPIRDSRALAEAFMRLRNDTNLREIMSQKARRRAHEVYGNDIIIPQLISLYQELLVSK
jgi:glycosyltransferase involved in cell wall biosynthesis